MDVALHGAFGYVEASCDLPVGESFLQEPQDLPLSGGETGQGLGVQAAVSDQLGQLREALGQEVLKAQGKDGLPSGQEANVQAESLHRELLHGDGRGTGLQEAEDDRVVLGEPCDDHVGKLSGVFLPQPSADLQDLLRAQMTAGHYEIDLLCPDLLLHLFRGVAVVHHLEVPGLVQGMGQSLTGGQVSVHDQDPPWVGIPGGPSPAVLVGRDGIR